MRWTKPVLTLAAAGMMGWAMPGDGAQPWAAWVAYALLALALRGLPARRAGGLGWLFGAASWGVATGTGMALGAGAESGIGLVYGSVMAALLALWQGVPYAVGAALWARAGWLDSPSRAVPAALALAGLVALLPAAVPGSPALSQYAMLPILQWAELGGEPLVHAFLIVTGLLLAHGVARRSVGLLTLACAVPLTMGVAGSGRLALWEAEEADAPRLTAGVVQPNLPRRWAEVSAPAFLEDGRAVFGPDLLAPLAAMTRTLAQDHPDVIIWPELGGFSYADAPLHRALATGLAAETGVPVLVPSSFVSAASPLLPGPAAEEARAFSASLSALHLVTPSAPAQTVPTHLKRRLFAQGETMPFLDRSAMLRRWFPDLVSMVPGPDANPPLPIKPGMAAIAAICFEATFPDLIADGVAGGGAVIVNVSNDTWFGRSAVSEIQLAHLAFRAAEFRRPALRVAQSGVSAALSAGGRLLPGSRTALLTAETRILSLPVPAAGLTPYARIGSVLPWLFLAFAAPVMLSRGRFLASPTQGGIVR